MRNNREAFDRWAIVPRMAHGVTRRDLSVELLGTRLSSRSCWHPWAPAS